MLNPLDLSSKVVLVTGASSGIGRTTAITLSRLGARVIVSSRRRDALQETQAMLEDTDRHAVHPFDFSCIDEIPGWLQSIADEMESPLNGIVHAAGLSTAIPLRILNRKRMDDLMLPNVYASLALIRGMNAKGVCADGAAMVLVSSVSGLAGAVGHTTYSASKAALHGMVRSAAKELASRRMRVNCVAPAWVHGPIMDVVNDLQGEAFQRVQERQFLGTISPEDVAVSVAYLLSDAASKVTGTTLVIDGGWTC